MGSHGPCVGMAGHKRFSGMPEHIPYACVIQVGNINDHSQALHLLHKCNPGIRKSMLCIRRHPEGAVLLCHPGIGKCQLIGEIPGQGHHAHTQPVKIPQKRRFTLAGPAFLHCEKGRHPALLPVSADILVGSDDSYDILMGFHFLVEGIEKFHAEFKGPSLGLFQIDIQGKILQPVIPCLHLFQIQHHLVLQDGLPASLLMVLIDFRNGIAVHIHNLHIPVLFPVLWYSQFIPV